MDKKNKAFYKSAIALLSITIFILLAAWVVPNYFFRISDSRILASVNEFDAAGIRLNFALDEQVSIDRLSELTRVNYTSGPIEQTSDDDKRKYAEILLEQLDLMHNYSVISADIQDALLPATYYADPELQIVLIETDHPQIYELLYEYGDTIYCSIMFDAEWDKVINLSIVITDPKVIDYGIDNELVLRGYIDWLELGGLYDWSYSKSTTNAISHSTIANLSLLVYCEVEDGMLQMNLRFMDA